MLAAHRFTHFDLICGTSAGGMLALGLAAEIPAIELKALFERTAPASLVAAVSCTAPFGSGSTRSTIQRIAGRAD